MRQYTFTGTYLTLLPTNRFQGSDSPNVTENDYGVRAYEYITYGLGVHYLLKAIIIQFVALLLTYQFARPLTISVKQPDVFIVVYFSISVGFIVITFLFIRNMCRRSLSPKMHNLASIVISTILYHLIAALVVVSGYTFLIVAVNGLSQINILDIFLSLLFTTAFAAILTVGYHDEFDEHLPRKETLEDAIEDWIETTAWTDEPDNSQAQRTGLSKFEDNCDNLVRMFSNARTKGGKELTKDLENWVSKFKDHKGQGKELVIQGQKHNKGRNKDLQTEYEEFQRLKSRLQDLSARHD